MREEAPAERGQCRAQDVGGGDWSHHAKLSRPCPRVDGDNCAQSFVKYGYGGAGARRWTCRSGNSPERID
ncbi:hypothetical protein DB32_007949 [Sandaracinus amylolyticus]|uniref:Uncharacterized protein n=1 Tax=Sandaracinus amylolyticus TaxID=927083 RepID=A0A0F6W9D6_9BACT|nr:hypothetical protein DB32_007949 [Sandaracinus amylolyticus]